MDLPMQEIGFRGKIIFDLYAERPPKRNIWTTKLPQILKINFFRQPTSPYSCLAAAHHKHRAQDMMPHYEAIIPEAELPPFRVGSLSARLQEPRLKHLDLTKLTAARVWSVKFTFSFSQPLSLTSCWKNEWLTSTMEFICTWKEKCQLSFE